ncbi:hypothetical protein AAHA92_03033 [Salvia divinorum]|uniref:Uncharacterized protein n=1 Tax=Salvia divinorum TaxID=28513 RepID=A0ABD1IGE1_SALDI
MLRRPWLRFQSHKCNALSMAATLRFSVFVALVLILSIIAATYNSQDTLFPPSSKFMNFLSSNQAALTGIGGCGVDEAIDCGDPEVFQLLMSAAFERLKDVDFYRFGKPVEGDNCSCCHMAWRFRHREGGFDEDNRNFRVLRFGNGTLGVVGIGDFHSGGNVKKRMVERVEIGEIVNGDRLMEEPFSRGKYLVYAGGDGDRCHGMGYYSWKFMCALGEAEFLNRTLVVDMNVCLSKIYTSSGTDEDKDFRFYYDFEMLKVLSSVVDQAEFWPDWNEWSKRDGLKVRVVEGSKVTPGKLAERNESLIVRRFGEADDFWWRVCEGESGGVIQQPWHKLMPSRQLWSVAAAITSRMAWDYDGVRVERREKAKKKELWPNLDNDTSPEGVMAALRGRGVEDGRRVYVATDEGNASFFDVLKERYEVQFLDDHRDLWDGGSDWYYDMRKMNNGSALEFDGYMRERVDDGVFKMGKTRIETFNDLTKDCKYGVNRC